MVEATVTQALKPCPFCGGESWAINSPVSPSIAIMCRSCGATGGLRDTEAEAIAAWNTRTAASQASDAGEAAVAKIIDPDAWHETLPTDGCGVYWIGRRNKARDQANAIRQLLSDPNGVLENKAGGLWYRRWHAAQTRVNELEQQVALSPPTSGEEMRLREALPRLDAGLIEAALVGHYGKSALSLGIDGVDLTVDDNNWTFRDGFKRMWAGVRRELNRRAALTKGAE